MTWTIRSKPPRKKSAKLGGKKQSCELSTKFLLKNQRSTDVDQAYHKDIKLLSICNKYVGLKAGLLAGLWGVLATWVSSRQLQPPGSEATNLPCATLALNQSCAKVFPFKWSCYSTGQFSLFILTQKDLALILLLLHPALLMHKNPQTRKVIHGMHPIGCKD